MNKYTPQNTAIFDAYEMQIMHNSNFLLTKHKVMQKMMEMFGQFSLALKDSPIHQYFPFPVGTDNNTGKTSKGDNYKGLPYLILDFPKKFDKTHIFTFRTMFWWANHFSFTVHLSGRYQEIYAPILQKNIAHLYKQGVYVGVGESAWQYHLAADNYLPLNHTNKFAVKEHLQNHHFIKLTRQLPVKSYEQFIPYGVQTYELFLKALSQTF